MKPSKPSHRILLAVSGLTPQIITETIFGLAHQSDPFHPTEMHVFTTSEGFDRARLTLLGEVTDKGGWLRRLASDYQLPPIQFSEDQIHVLKDATGTALADIRTEEDNVLLADMIISTMQGFIAKYGDDCAIHVSIAGGRKTMGFYVGYALSLLGRAQDKLSHVLVSEHFEGHDEFFYPTPYSRIITTRLGKPLDTKEAKVSLAEIPFVRLRNAFSHQLLSDNMTYSELIKHTQNVINGQIAIRLDDQQRSLIVNGHQFVLEPVNYAFYRVFVDAACNNHNGYHYKPDSDALAERFLSYYRFFGGGDYDNVAKLLADGMTKEYFEQRLTNIKRNLEKHLGVEGAKPYRPKQSSEKTDGFKRYQLELTQEQINIDHKLNGASA
jgi:CRISPR-associated protein (TIGR02584 family)